MGARSRRSLTLVCAAAVVLTASVAIAPGAAAAPAATGRISGVVVSPDAPQGGAAGWYTACTDVATGNRDVTVRFQPGAAIGGVVTDLRTGKPLAGAQVGVFDTNNQYPGYLVTDARGRWRFRNLRPERTYGTPSGASKVTATAPHGDTPAALGAVVNLRAGRVISGLAVQVVPVVGYSGTVRNKAGRSLGGGLLASVRTTTDFQSALTDSDGRWTILSPWSGTADVCASDPYAAVRPTGLALAWSVVESDATDVTQDVSLDADGGAVTGSVVLADGSSPDGAVRVSVPVPVASGGTIDLPGRQHAGAYTVAGLPPGTYQVEASVAHAGDTTARGFSTPVTVTRGAVTTFSTITLSSGA